MNWEQELLNLYEINADKVGQVNYRVYRKKGEDLKVPYVLLPPFHTTVDVYKRQVIMSLLNVVLKAAIAQINIFQGGFRQFQYVRWILPGQEIVCPLHLSCLLYTSMQ